MGIPTPTTTKRKILSLKAVRERMRCKQSGNDLLFKLFPQGKLALDIDKHLPVPTYQTSLSELECVIKY